MMKAIKYLCIVLSVFFLNTAFVMASTYSCTYQENWTDGDNQELTIVYDNGSLYVYFDGELIKEDSHESGQYNDGTYYFTELYNSRSTFAKSVVNERVCPSIYLDKKDPEYSYAFYFGELGSNVTTSDRYVTASSTLTVDGEEQEAEWTLCDTYIVGEDGLVDNQTMMGGQFNLYYKTSEQNIRNIKITYYNKSSNTSGDGNLVYEGLVTSVSNPYIVLGTEVSFDTSSLKSCKLVIEVADRKTEQTEEEEANDDTDDEFNENDLNAEANIDADWSDGDCESYLGSVTNSSDPAYYLHFIFNLMKYAAILILLVMSMIEFIKAIVSQDAAALKKAATTTMKRVVIAIVIFLLPYLIEALFEAIGVYSSSTCGIAD